MMDWTAEFEAELSNAARARARGNEGRARVCARRAAGIVARQYLEQTGASRQQASALDLLQLLRLQPALPPGALPLVDHLTQSVDRGFSLPAEVDLVSDARRLRRFLLPD